jgi:ABC-2 type transport system permease protein
MINWVALKTIVRKECVRIFRIWPQTLLPPAITMSLYFVIFGHVIGSRIGLVDGYNYIQFIAPGLVMMTVILNAYANVSASFFSAKFTHSVQELMVAPVSEWTILLGYTLGGVIRALVVGAVVLLVASFFTHVPIHHFFSMLAILLISAWLFALAGFFNALFANTFDDISIVPNFVLTPLTYLGGVFYSIQALPPAWRVVAHFNPVLYLMSGFRYGMLGVADVSPWIGLSISIGASIFFAVLCYVLLKRGKGLRT